jgi:hypothetical protein
MKHRSPEQSFFTREKKFVAILAAAGALGSAALTSCSIEAQDVKLKPAETSTSVDSGRTYDSDIDTVRIENTVINGIEKTEEERFNLTDDEYYKIDESLRAKDQAEYFRIGVEKSYTRITDPAAPRSSFTPDELVAMQDGTFYLPDLDKPRSERTDQDLLNYSTLAIYYVTAMPPIENNDPERNAEIKSLSVVSRPGTNTHDNLREHIEESPGVGIITMYRAIPTPLSGVELPPSASDLIPENSLGARLVGHESLIDHRVDYTLFVDYGDEEDNVISVDVHTFGDLFSPGLREMIDQYGKS